MNAANKIADSYDKLRQSIDALNCEMVKYSNMIGTLQKRIESLESTVSNQHYLLSNLKNNGSNRLIGKQKYVLSLEVGEIFKIRDGVFMELLCIHDVGDERQLFARHVEGNMKDHAYCYKLEKCIRVDVQ